MTHSRVLISNALLAATATAATQIPCDSCIDQPTTHALVSVAQGNASGSELFGQPYEGPNTIEGEDPDEAALAEFIREIRAETERQQAQAEEARGQAEAAEEAAPARAGDAPAQSQATSVQELLDYIRNGPPASLE